MRLLSAFGIDVDFKQQTLAYQETLTNIMLVFSLVVLGVFSVVHLMLGDTMLGLIQAAVFAVNAFVFFDPFHVISKNVKSGVVVFGPMLVFLFLLVDGGIDNTGIYWVPFLPFMAFAVVGVYRGLYWLALFALGFLAIVVLDYLDLVNTPYSFVQLLFFSVAFVFYVLVALIFEGLRVQQQMNLAQKNESLVQVREELNHTLNHLEEEIERRTAELRESNRKLAEEIEKHRSTNRSLQETEQKFFQAQKMEALGTLVGGIAHDFSNVMSGISAHLFLIQREIKGNALVQEKLDDVERLVFHASDMSKQLLTFARKDKIEKEIFDMTSFIGEAVKLGQASLPTRIKLEKHIADISLPVQGSPTQLQQVLLNLLGNAKDALAHTERPIISITLKPLAQAEHMRERHPDLEGEWLYLQIRDNGEGISSENLIHIFEPFFTTKKEGKGTGLGLAMCYGAIQSHGGLIEAESGIGVGTTFHIYLPLISMEPEKGSLNAVEQSLSGQGETILIVDDDKALRVAHKTVLEKLGYKVLQASDGLEAMKVYARHRDDIDLVMMDSMMPNMDGYKAAQHILAINKHAKIFFATAYEKDSTTGRWLSESARELDHLRRLHKPFTIEQLCQVIREELDKPAS